MLIRVALDNPPYGPRWKAAVVTPPGEEKSPFCSVAPSAEAALQGLLIHVGLADALVTEDPRPAGMYEVFYRVDEPRPAACPECKGTGLYHGLTVVEPCRACASDRSITILP